MSSGYDLVTQDAPTSILSDFCVKSPKEICFTISDEIRNKVKITDFKNMVKSE